ncbi:MAG: D-aminoacylase [Deltaproteobacteria bacterium]|nr:D-aminoacylase [Deltaproteobacteria bacterium]
MNDLSSYDILIKNGMIYSGISNEPETADIGIQGDKISAVGKLDRAARRVIDATGHIVTPGFIDVHTHCDIPFMFSDSLRDKAPGIPSVKGNWNYLYQGVTTVVTGNCGIGYPDITQWFDLVDSLGFGTNVYHLAPQGQIRAESLGDDQPAVPTGKQLELLKAKVAEAMEAGAVGLSTGLIYPPGFLTRTDEIVELARVAARYGGIYTSHIRDESGRLNAHGERGVIASIKEAVEIGKRAEIPVNISHLKICEPINNMNAQQILDVIEEARSEGLDVTADQYPYDASSTTLTAIMPDEFVKSGGVKEEYKTRKGRQKIGKSLSGVFHDHHPENIMISVFPRSSEFEGKNLVEISEMLGQDPFETFIELVCDNLPPQCIFFEQDINIVRDIIKQDYVLTGSDGQTVRKDYFRPHPRSYGTFTRKIRKFVIEEKQLDLARAIRSMTSLPAEKFNLKGRGRISEGAYADIAVIDLNRLTDRATYLEPHHYSEGVHYLLVNGVLAIDRGRATDAGGGRGVRRA